MRDLRILVFLIPHPVNKCNYRKIIFSNKKKIYFTAGGAEGES
jgi:hypothetical protein